MRTFPVDPPRAINHNRLIAALGHPCEVHFRPADGKAVAVTVQDSYSDLAGNVTVPATTDDQVRAAITANDPSPSPPTREERDRVRLKELTTKLVAGTATPAETDEAIVLVIRRLVP